MTIRINHKKKELQLSVRDLSFHSVFRLSKTQFSFKSAEFGQEIHQKIQNQKQEENANYEREYFVKYNLLVQGWRVIIRGRIDLVAKSSDSINIEEIKSVSLKQFSGSHKDPRIKGFKQQLQCYAWILKQTENIIPSPSLQLILVNRFDNTQHNIPIPYRDMSKFTIKRIEQIISTEEARQLILKKKVNSLSNIQFPFTYRKYQKDIINKIEEITEKELNLIMEAPSGLGKTVVSLFPLITKTILEETKIFFLTSKTTQRHIVEKTLNLFLQQKVRFLAISLKAKEKMCTNSIYFCHEDYCPFLRNYLQHFPEKLFQKFTQKNEVVTPEEIEKEAAISEAFCPFEFALDITLEADIIIGDYNYVFHPRVFLQRFFGEQIPRSKRGYYLIVDEAHNLVNRSLSYYSHTFSRKQVIELKRSMQQLKNKVKGIPLPNSLPPQLERIFRILQSECNSSISIHLLNELDITSFQKIMTQFEEEINYYVQFLVEKELHWPDDPILSFFYKFRDFVETVLLAQGAEEFSILYYTNEVQIKILCKDASFFLGQRLLYFKSAFAISATITPFPFYRDLLGFPIDKTVYKRFPSPFPPENRKIIVFPDIDTRYTQRSYYYEDIATLIQKVIKLKQGKYFVFFPSFKFIDKVSSFIKPNFDLIILKQTPTMQESDRRDFISTMKKKSHVLALAVTAGIFAEGIDFPGVLDGVIVIGPSLPAVSFERELIKQYYEERFSSGFTYAYQFPGLTRTFQAAGRLIRTSSDRGIIIFVGRRFSSPNYSNYFPRYYYQKSPKELINYYPEHEIAEFWKKYEL